MREINIIYELVEHGFSFGYYIYNVKYPYFHKVFGVYSDRTYFVHFNGSYNVKRGKDGIREMLEIQRMTAAEFLRWYFPTVDDDINYVESIFEIVKVGDE